MEGSHPMWLVIDYSQRPDEYCLSTTSNGSNSANSLHPSEQWPRFCISLKRRFLLENNEKADPQKSAFHLATLWAPGISSCSPDILKEFLRAFQNPRKTLCNTKGSNWLLASEILIRAWSVPDFGAIPAYGQALGRPTAKSKTSIRTVDFISLEEAAPLATQTFWKLSVRLSRPSKGGFL